MCDVNIFKQFMEGAYDLDDYVLVDSQGEIQAVSGNSEFFDAEVVPTTKSPYVVLKFVQAIRLEEAN
jgi:hypothetical protein